MAKYAFRLCSRGPVHFLTEPAIAQDDEGELAPIVITGSNIPTVDLEGPSPVVTIDREEIDS